jgi:hypothetical protein
MTRSSDSPALLHFMIAIPAHRHQVSHTLILMVGRILHGVVSRHQLRRIPICSVHTDPIPSNRESRENHKSVQGMMAT